jgi:hypothetical protein
MIFIRFLEDIQVEAIQRNTSPGDDWMEAPSDFDWDKMHKLVNGEIVEMEPEEFIEEPASIGEQHA